MGSEILRSHGPICYLWSEIWGRRDYLGSDICSMSLSKPFLGVKLFFETGQLIIWDF